MDADIDISDVIQSLVAKYVQRSCPKCNGCLGIVVLERKARMLVEAINGRCLQCGYRPAWVSVRGKTLAERAELRRLSGLIRGVEKIYCPSNLGQ